MARLPGDPWIIWSPDASCVLCCVQNRMNSVSREGGLWGLSRAAGQAVTSDPGSYPLVIKGLTGISTWEATSSGIKVPLGRGPVPIAVPLLLAAWSSILTCLGLHILLFLLLLFCLGPCSRRGCDDACCLITAIYGLAYKTLTQSQCSKDESPGSFMHVCKSKSQGEAAGRHELMFQESREFFPSCELRPSGWSPW